jgi:hypothetical protein
VISNCASFWQAQAGLSPKPGLLPARPGEPGNESPLCHGHYIRAILQPYSFVGVKPILNIACLKLGEAITIRHGKLSTLLFTMGIAMMPTD